ncbi:MAG: threonine/serine exporter family protein [Lachnospiraceae bacterium]|nr:threonine/serine exporter family protein [Lachnospiraceae bacterium]MDE6981316.1 threonine/serine exporter family protein [Lachnospiraceae bacterium]
MSYNKEILTLAVEIGDELLRNGGEIYRVEDTIFHILKAFEIENYDVYVLSNGIFASANEDSDESCSIIRHVPLGDVHLGRIAAINQLSREISEKKCDLKTAWDRLEQCRHIPIPDPKTLIFFGGLGCSCYTYIFGGNFLDAIFAFLFGMILEIYLIYTRRKKTSKFISNIVGSAFVTFASLLVLHIGLPVLQDKIVIGDIMPLVPGVALTTSIRDLFNGDYLSGAIHLLDALLTAMCIAVGVGSMIILYRYIPGGVPLL